MLNHLFNELALRFAVLLKICNPDSEGVDAPCVSKIDLVGVDARDQSFSAGNVGFGEFSVGEQDRIYKVSRKDALLLA